jgi:hypothetical protein
MSNLCRFCGKELKNPQARFCPACGRQLVPPDASHPAGAKRHPPSPPPLCAQEQPHLVIRVPGQPLQEIALGKMSYTIGRRPDNDIVLPLKYVSGHHGRLERRETGQGAAWHFADLGSTNGTFVNGQRAQSA